MCLWLGWDKVILKPPAGTAFGSQIAKSGVSDLAIDSTLALWSLNSLESRKAWKEFVSILAMLF